MNSRYPQSFTAASNNGTVAASSFLDDLQVLQASVRDSQGSHALEYAWSNDIQLQVPDLHVSLGDIRRTLHQWLGHEIQITAEVRELLAGPAIHVSNVHQAARPTG